MSTTTGFNTSIPPSSLPPARRYPAVNNIPIPAIFLSNLRSKKSQAGISLHTATLMQCPQCGANRYITATGLVCSRGCGRIVPIPPITPTGFTQHVTITDTARLLKIMRAAWPGRVVEVADVSRFGK